MKKFNFGLTLMISSSIIIAGALIGGGAIAGGSGMGFDIYDSRVSSVFITLGIIMFLIGFIVSGIEALKKES